MGDKRFAQGVVGFVRHLSKGHGIKPDGHNRGRLDWTMKRCEFREVSNTEIVALTEGTGDYRGPQKVPFRQTIGPKGVDLTSASLNSNAAKLGSPSATSGGASKDSGKERERETPKASVQDRASIFGEEPSSTVPTKRRYEKKELDSDLEDLSSEQTDNSGDEDFAPPRGTTATHDERESKKARHSVPFSPKGSLRQSSVSGKNRSALKG